MMRLGKSYHVSRFTFFAHYVVVALLIAGGAAAYASGMSYAIYASAFGLAVLIIAVSELRIRSNKIILANDVVIIESGVFSKNSTRINYGNITDIRVQQTFLQRAFRYGDIEMGVPGSFLQQNFSGKGDVKVDAAGLHPGVTLRKFQNIRSIEKSVLSRVSEHHKTRKQFDRAQ